MPLCAQSLSAAEMLWASVGRRCVHCRSRAKDKQRDTKITTAHIPRARPEALGSNLLFCSECSWEARCTTQLDMLALRPPHHPARLPPVHPKVSASARDSSLSGLIITSTLHAWVGRGGAAWLQHNKLAGNFGRRYRRASPRTRALFCQQVCGVGGATCWTWVMYDFANLADVMTCSQQERKNHFQGLFFVGCVGKNIGVT